MAVAAAVDRVVAGLLGARQQRLAQVLGERALVDPVPAPLLARLGEQRADRPVGQAVGEEVQVVEDDEAAEREVRVQRAADGDREDRVGAALLQRGDVRLVGDHARQQLVAGTVARDVQHVDAGEAPARDRRRPEARLDELGLAVGLDARQRVGARAREDPDPHHGAGS